jgi:hypothetical protein
MSEPDLEVVNTHDLLDELVSRFDAAVFIGVKDLSVERNRVEIMWRGEEVRCADLAEAASDLVKRYSREEADES